MKRMQLIFSVVVLVVDYAMLLLAAYVAYAVRYMAVVQEVRPVIFDLPFGTFFSIAALVAVGWIIVFAFVGMYSVVYRQRAVDEISRVIAGCSLGFVGIITFLFWSRELFSSRFIMLAALVFAIMFVSLARMILRSLRRSLLKHDKGTTKIVLVGTDSTSASLEMFFKLNPVWGYRVVNRLDVFDEKKIQNLLKTNVVDEVFLTDATFNKATRLQVYDFCIKYHLGFRYAADMFDAQSHNVDIQTLGGVPIIEIKKTRLDGWGRVVKRLFDIIVSFVAIVLCLPIFLVIAIAIKIDSKGPVIYKNTRVGKDGKTFTLLKFRRLKTEFCVKDDYDTADPALTFERELIATQNNRQGGLYKIVNDPRATRVGAYLERTSLDELPQLFNVLIGTMSLVGPRPHQPREVAQFPERHERVMAIKPGITGLAQISGRSDLDTHEELRLDVYYIEHWSLAMDITILAKTPFVLIGRHAS